MAKSVHMKHPGEQWGESEIPSAINSIEIWIKIESRHHPFYDRSRKKSELHLILLFGACFALVIYSHLSTSFVSMCCS